MLKKIKDILYKILVESNADIRYFHRRYVSSLKIGGGYTRMKSLLYLVKLTVLIRIFRSKKYKTQKSARPYISGPESALSHKSPEEFAEKLLGYDVISFDVFDTLVFRPFGDPKDLFYIVGQKLDYLDFANLRAQFERKARKFAAGGEPDIYEIYNCLEKYCGINARSGAELEFQIELGLIYANGFMKKVYDILAAHNKKMIAATDMYLTEGMIREILDNCGYENISEIFVSCEYKKSKHSGELFGIIKSETGNNLRYIHVGDNWFADFEQPKKRGFAAVHYENVNHKGAEYRVYDMSAITGAAYRGIVNAHFHSGLGKYSMAYEYGFMCGGLFVLGYCGFIRGYAQANGIEKILFLSRDGEILKQVYDMLYPGNNSEYVYWSRNAAAKLGADKYRHDYFRRFVYHKINSDNSDNNNGDIITISKIFRAMELDALLPGFGKSGKIPASAALDSENAEKIIEYLTENWAQVKLIYEKENAAAKEYYKNIIGGCKKIGTVDIGWAGSGGVILDYLISDIWGLDCQSHIILAGTNTANNAEPDMSEGFLQSGKMSAYLYSQAHNRDIYKFHDPGAMHNVFFELLLSSESAGLKGFGEAGPVFAPETGENNKIIGEIRTGIIDFIKIYRSNFKNFDYMFNISGADAYAPFMHLAADGNRYFKKLFEDIYFDIGVGDEKKIKIF